MEDKWIEVFRGGRQTDSNGVSSDWSDKQIDFAVTSFDPAKHEPPVVIGHPKDNLPAYGWVDGLKREGNVLLAKFKQVAPEFAQLVKDGRLKKRSVSFYPDGRLRHVGFLGAVPPAVKGLKDIAFGEEEIAIYEYEESDLYNNNHNHKEDSVTLEEALRENEQLRGKVAILEREKKDAETQKTEFAEKVTVAETRAVKAEKELKDFKDSAAKTTEIRVNKEISEFVEGLIKEGKVAPADKEKKIAALTAAAKVQSYEFAEDGSDTFGELKAAFKSMPVKDEFKDFSGQYSKTENGETKLNAAEILKKM